MFVNKVLRKIFGAKRDEITEWRKLHNSEQRAVYFSLNICRDSILLGKPEGKRLLRRPRGRWEVIKIHLRKVGCDPGVFDKSC